MRGCVEPHVVDYPVVLNVAAYRRESLSVFLHSLFTAWHIHIINSINLTGWVAWRFWTRSYDQLRRLEEFNFKEVKFLLASTDDLRVKIRKGTENSSLSHPSIIILLSYKSCRTQGHSITTNSFFPVAFFNPCKVNWEWFPILSWYAQPLPSGSTVVKNETLYLSRGWSVSGWWWWGKEGWRTGLWLHPWPFCRGSVCPHRGHNPNGNHRKRSAAPFVSLCSLELLGQTRPRGRTGLQSTAWRNKDASQIRTDTMLQLKRSFTRSCCFTWGSLSKVSTTYLIS